MSRPVLRKRILSFLGVMIVLSLLGFSLSLLQITEINRLMDGMNQSLVPGGRRISALLADAQIYEREQDRGLGFTHWKEPRWKPRLPPAWMDSVMDDHLRSLGRLAEESRGIREVLGAVWFDQWNQKTQADFFLLRQRARQLYGALSNTPSDAETLYPEWAAAVEAWRQHLQWGAEAHERLVRQGFSVIESRIDRLRAGLQLVLISVFALSLLLFWLGDRMLRPLSDLTLWVRQIRERGIQKHDKQTLPPVAPHRADEVAELEREFHRLTTALLEREKTVDSQNTRLKQMGEFNENILKSIRSLLVVWDSDQRIQHANPAMQKFLSDADESSERTQALEALRHAAQTGEIARWKGRLYAVQTHALVTHQGEIWVIEDVTDAQELKDRLRHAEQLAAVGRLSAQVAHEVRNPLHSIGLEAEMALEEPTQTPRVRESLRSILHAVKRLDHITENYLSLSRHSPERLHLLDLRQVVQDSCAGFAAALEHAQVEIRWSFPEHPVWIRGDERLLEQAFGNLIKNSLQAFEHAVIEHAQAHRHITLQLSSLESGRARLLFQDTGPGIPTEVRDRLFTPFVTTKAQGTGLGLSFVKKVIDDHGGRLEWIASESGACFEMTLPQETQRHAVSVSDLTRG